METDPWLDFLNSVGATFWRGFPYDIAFFAACVWATKWREEMRYVTYFMAGLIAINLAIGTIPAWFDGKTY